MRVLNPLVPVARRPPQPPCRPGAHPISRPADPAPFATALPIVELWVQAPAPAEHECDVAEANPVSDGQNVVFLQAKDDAPLAFREQIDGLWVANWFRLYVDLRRDPRRGHEQADHLRREVIKF